MQNILLQTGPIWAIAAVKAASSPLGMLTYPDTIFPIELLES